MKKLLIVISPVLLAWMCHTAWSETWYVDCPMPESGDGTSRETAVKTIQEGIDAATDGDTVVVAEAPEGRYLFSSGQHPGGRQRRTIKALKERDNAIPRKHGCIPYWPAIPKGREGQRKKAWGIVEVGIVGCLRGLKGKFAEAGRIACRVGAEIE